MALSSSDSGPLPRLLSLLGTLLPTSFAYLTLIQPSNLSSNVTSSKKLPLSMTTKTESSLYILLSPYTFLGGRHHSAYCYVIPQEGNPYRRKLNEGNGSRDAKHGGDDCWKPLPSLGLEGWWRRILAELKSWGGLGGPGNLGEKPHGVS